MLEKQNLETEKISVFFELITSEDSRYKKQREQYPDSLPNKKPVLPVVYTDAKDTSPYVSAQVKDQIDEYIENNPDVMHSIISCEEDNILKSYPKGKPHSEEIKICDVYILTTEDDMCIISEFNFEDIKSLCLE
jgi:hypothetical protein